MIGETVLRIRATAEIRELRRAVVDDHAVDDVQRIGSGDERVRAAQPHGDTAAARSAGVLRDLRARHLALQRLIDRHRLRATDQGRRIDRRDARSELSSSRSARPIR